MNGHETVKGGILEDFFLAGQYQAARILVRSGPEWKLVVSDAD